MAPYPVGALGLIGNGFQTIELQRLVETGSIKRNVVGDNGLSLDPMTPDSPRSRKVRCFSGHLCTDAMDLVCEASPILVLWGLNERLVGIDDLSIDNP